MRFISQRPCLEAPCDQWLLFIAESSPFIGKRTNKKAPHRGWDGREEGWLGSGSGFECSGPSRHHTRTPSRYPSGRVSTSSPQGTPSADTHEVPVLLNPPCTRLPPIACPTFFGGLGGRGCTRRAVWVCAFPRALLYLRRYPERLRPLSNKAVGSLTNSSANHAIKVLFSSLR